MQYLLDQAKKVMAKEQKRQTRHQQKTASKFQNASMNQSKFSAVGNTTMQSKMNETMGGTISLISDEERARIDARRIGPFSFDIDDDIDTEVLNNE